MTDNKATTDNSKSSDKQKVLVVYYIPRAQRFRIPRGLDLEDDTKVKEYYVRRGILFIEFVDGTFKNIKPYDDADDDGDKPCDENIESDSDDEDYDENVSDEQENDDIDEGASRFYVVW